MLCLESLWKQSGAATTSALHLSPGKQRLQLGKSINNGEGQSNTMAAQHMETCLELLNESCWVVGDRNTCFFPPQRSVSAQPCALIGGVRRAWPLTKGELRGRLDHLLLLVQRSKRR